MQIISIIGELVLPAVLLIQLDAATEPILINNTAATQAVTST